VDSVQGRDLAHFFRDLSQSEKLSEIKAPLEKGKVRIELISAVTISDISRVIKIVQYFSDFEQDSDF
jgi:hypothetical protein